MGRRHKKRKNKPGGDTTPSRALDLELKAIEIARGYDGPLRGAPEPALVLAIYRVTAQDVTLIARRAVRLSARGVYPERIEVNDDLGARVPRVAGMRVLVLAAMLEEDSGRGIERVYADLEATSSLAAWAVDAHVPDPISLIEWARSTPALAPSTARVHLVDAAGDLRDQELGDDWIGAALFHLDDVRHERSERRMRFASQDGRNDWTAVFDVRLV